MSREGHPLPTENPDRKRVNRQPGTGAGRYWGQWALGTIFSRRGFWGGGRRIVESGGQAPLPPQHGR
jgi:hypothetical protein